MDSHIEHTDLSHQNDLGFGTGNSRIDKAPRQHPGMTSQQREYHHIELAALRLMDGGGIGKLDMAHFFHRILHDSRGRELDRYTHTVPLIVTETADKANIAVGCLATVPVLHDFIAYAKIVVVHFQVSFLRLWVHQFADRFVELISRGRAGGTEGREDLHTVYAVLLHLCQIDNMK